MNFNPVIRKSWLVMFFAIRLLTLVAFTAHAVLGCCLSHGSCMQEQAAILTGHGCDHDGHACDSHGHDDEHASNGHEIATASIAENGVDTCPLEGHGHSNHCDDGQCVFGIAEAPTSFSDLQSIANPVWINASVDFWQVASRAADFVGSWLDGPPKAPLTRAVHQVWLI
jgi:hypothetical protein